MSFQPIVPMSGIGGWNFLKRTMEKQQQTFNRSPVMEREAQYFKENIGKVKRAEDLVSDYRLLKVALGAFGLQDDINNRFFIRKVLEEGSLNEKSLGNLLSDKRYLEMAKAFGFDLGTPSTQISTFADKIVKSYREREFEVAVGYSDENMRLGLTIRRDLAALAKKESSENTKWFTALGSPPMRKVLETAFNLPSSFGSLDLDMQLATVKDKARQAFGSETISQFTDPEKMEALVQRFLVRAEVQAMTTSFSAGSIALQLLQAGNPGR